MPSRDGRAGADGYAEVYEALGRALAAGDFEAYANGAFLNHVGESMLEWLDCLAAIEATEPRGTEEVVAD